jgi:hypothetical protein
MLMGVRGWQSGAYAWCLSGETLRWGAALGPAGAKGGSLRFGVLLVGFVLMAPLVAAGCSRSSSTHPSGNGGQGGGAGSTPSTNGQGGRTSPGTSIVGTGGLAVSGTGGQVPPATGGATGGATGATATGGQAGQGTGGAATGGQSSTGTATDRGGSSSGGRTGAGGAATGGRTGTGGAPGTGGAAPIRDGGAGTGGAQGSGGSTSTATACCAKFGSPTSAGQIAISALSALSGLVASRAHPGVLYAHADHGTGAIVYALTVTGASLGSFTLSGATVTDWEDISVGPGPNPGSFVYVGDIGDNAARTGSGSKRTEIQVYRVPEPAVSATTPLGSLSVTNWQRLRFSYPDAAHDAETLMVDPVTGDLLVVTKETSGVSKVFRAPGTTPADSPTVLELVATLAIGSSGAQSALVTAGDIAPGGESVILRSYAAIWLWCRQGTWTSTFAVAPTELPSASEPQSEGLSFSSDGKAWYSAGETSTTLYQATSGCSM